MAAAWIILLFPRLFGRDDDEEKDDEPDENEIRRRLGFTIDRWCSMTREERDYWIMLVKR